MTSAAPSAPPGRPWSALAMTGPVLLAAALTWTRVPFRWNQIALAYGAYFREYFAALQIEGLRGLTQFVGIHPPAYSLLFLGMRQVGVSPATWFVVSGAWSVLAVLGVGLTARRAGLGPALTGVAALLLATSPHRLAYALEPNNYPMLLAVVALQGAAFARFGQDGRGRVALGALTLLGLWTHALFVTVPIAQAIALSWPRGPRWRPGLTTFAVAALLCLPLVPSVLEGAGSTVNVGGGLAVVGKAMLLDFPARYGAAWAGWVVAVAAGIGGIAALRARPISVVTRAWAAQVLVGGGLLALLLARGTAAAHQFPYYLLLLPPGCLLAATALRAGPVPGRAALAALLLMAVGANVQWTVGESRRARAAFRAAAVTHPMVARGVGAWTEGSVLLLLGFPTGGDDDKDVVDPAYALVPMDQRVRHDEPEVPTLVGGDPYWGQPYGYPGDRWLYTFTGFIEDRFEGIFAAHRGRGERLVVVVYDTDQAPNDVAAVAAWGRRHGVEPLRGARELLFVFGPGPP